MARSMSNPQFEALTHWAERDAMPDKLDGMTHKALRARGWVADGRITEEGLIAQRAEEVRRNERGLRGVRRGDMIRYLHRQDLGWGVVMAFTTRGEVKATFGGTFTLLVPGSMVEAVERRPDSSGKENW